MKQAEFLPSPDANCSFTFIIQPKESCITWTISLSISSEIWENEDSLSKAVLLQGWSRDALDQNYSQMLVKNVNF